MTDTAPTNITGLSSVRDFIRWGASRMNEAQLFFGHGTDNALDEAAALVLHALSLGPELPDVYLSAALTPPEREAVVGLINRRIEERLPAAYIIHQAWFMGLPFYVDQRVLVPRSPIAELIENQFQPWLDEPAAAERILDLCTGSGCIGIACAHVFPTATVDLVDISADALAVARRNVAEHGLHERIRVIESDLFNALAGQRYDIIVSNPPYVDTEEFAAMPPEYRHEPALGLSGGVDGLDFVRRILREASDHLTDNGLLVVEVGVSRNALLASYPGIPFIWPEFARGGHGVFVLTVTDLREVCDMLAR